MYNDKERKFTKIKLWDENGTYTIKIPRTELSTGDFIQELVMPLLKSIGYTESSIEKYIDIN